MFRLHKLQVQDYKSYEIYALIDPRDHLVYYVGMSENAQSRFQGHLGSTYGNLREREWILQLRAEGLLPILHIIETIEASTDADTIARDRELYWIRELFQQGHPLVNVVGIKAKYWYPAKRKAYEVKKPKYMQDEEMLTVDQAARFLQVNERTVRGYIASGELPVMTIGKRGYRIAKSDLLAFIEKRKRRLKGIED